MSDAFEEVEEGLRRDRYAGFFRNYGLWVLAAVALLLAGVAGFQWYQKWSVDRAASFAEKLAEGQQLLESGEFAAAERFLTDLAKSAPPAYKSAALSMAGTANLEQRELEDALKNFDEAAKAARDPLLRDSAAMKAAYVAADVQDFKTLEPRLNKLIEGKGPYSFLARELLGMEAYEAGDVAKAREQFNILASAIEAPEGVRGRARSAMAVIGAPVAAAAPKPAEEKSGEQK